MINPTDPYRDNPALRIHAPMVGILPLGPDTLTRESVAAHKSRTVVVADYIRYTTDPDAAHTASALYANAAAWELWLAREAWGRGATFVWHGHVVSALSLALRAGDWARVAEVRKYLDTANGERVASHGVEDRAVLLAHAAKTEARWRAYRDPPMPTGG